MHSRRGGDLGNQLPAFFHWVLLEGIIRSVAVGDESAACLGRTRSLCRRCWHGLPLWQTRTLLCFPKDEYETEEMVKGNNTCLV